MDATKQDDLDIFILARGIKNGIKGLFKSLGWLIEFTLKKFWSLCLYGLIGAAAFFCLSLLIKPYYTAHLSISHVRFENDFCYEVIENLDEFLNGSNGYIQLSKELGLSVEKAQHVKRLSYLPSNPNVANIYADSVSVILPFKVEAEVYDNSVLDSLQYCLLSYFESNPYAQKLKAIDKQALEKTEQKLKDELAKTDSLRTLVNQGIVPRGSGNGIILGEPINPVSVYKMGLDLYEKQLELYRKQQLNNSFDVTVGFSKKTKPSNSGVVFYLVLGLLGGYISGLIILLRKQLKKEGHIPQVI